MKTFTQFIAACALLTSSISVFAHSPQHTAPTHNGGHSAHQTTVAQQAWGKPGQASEVSRTIEVSMTDDMRFAPEQITVKLGETVRIRLVNAGQLMHEMVLGTPDTLQHHAAMMLQAPDMAHGDAYMAHVAPQDQGELLWSFNQLGTFDFACLIAGHFQSGMRGTVTVTH